MVVNADFGRKSFPWTDEGESMMGWGSKKDEEEVGTGTISYF